MLRFNFKKLFSITAIILAVILIVFGISGLLKTDFVANDEIAEDELNLANTLRHPLTGKKLEQESLDFFPISVMIDNAYDLPYSAGLDQADVVYEALVEGNITRLLAIFDSNIVIDKIGPVRSARNYFMDWAQEYGGVYMHVGGSPQALAVITDYDFENIDQIGAGEIYFWRDNNLNAPHNVFTSASNISRLKEWKDIADIERDFVQWNFVEPGDVVADYVPNFVVDFSSTNYQVTWKYNQTLNVYQRWRNQEKQVSHTGEQLQADNVVIQVVESDLIDAERRGMKTSAGGEVIVYNRFGRTTGIWQKNNNRTQFFTADGREISLVPGQTWVEIVDDLEQIIE